MLDDLDHTLRTLLLKEVPPIKESQVDISFDQPNGEWSTRLNERPTVNLFLYDVRENPTLRQHQWESLPGGNGRDNRAHRKRTPFRVDCSYMLTAWSKYPDDEHRLLTLCMLALFRFPILPKDYLVGSLQDQPFDILARLASHDKLTNPAEVWSALNNEIRPSIPYVVTLAFDPWTEITGPIVRTLSLHSGQSNTLPRLVEGTRSEMIDIGGTIRGKEQDGAPLQGIEVTLKETGLLTATNKKGRFVLGSLPPGEYTLVARRGKGKPQEKQIGVPEKEGNYDMELE